MNELVLTDIAAIIVVGILAQWIAWRIGLPSILLLLIFGFIAGPVSGLIDPDLIFGHMLFPLISISVAVILFEGGLNLSIDEYRQTGGVVHRLISVGALSTWCLIAIAASMILGLDLSMSVLLGAILVVSGPTVVAPLLAHIRPRGSLASILNWEGMLIDPIGALLAVMVYEIVISRTTEGMTALAFSGLIKTVFVGGSIGFLSAYVIVILLKRYWIPDILRSPMTLMTVILAFTLSNLYQSESGLLSVTIMGITLANQRQVAIKHITDFVENLRVLLLSLLFIVLAARLDLSILGYMNTNTYIFLAILILVVRPLAVFISTLFSGLSVKEKVFLSLVYPRGIVAAAVASIFAIHLSEAGFATAAGLLPITFITIIATVIVYGIGSPIVARILKLSEPDPQGVLIVGGNAWAIKLAKAIEEEGFRVLLTDTNRFNIYTARLKGIRTHHGSIVSEKIMRKLDLSGIGKLISLTPNDGVNSLASLHFAEIFGSSEVYQLCPKEAENVPKEDYSKDLHGRFLFGEKADYSYLTNRFTNGAIIKKTNITEGYDYDTFLAQYGAGALPLFLISETKTLTVFTREDSPVPKAGQTLLSLVDPDVREEKRKLEKKKEETLAKQSTPEKP
ncbi:MAG: cation:proton antiporter [Thermodesulfobacteriota bacterium]